ncbi:hypothetical protein G3V91_22385 [Escherichia coli]|nr:hypothetical protein [Escherichia coli]
MNAVEDGVTWRETLEGLVERTRNPQKLAKFEALLAAPPLPAAGAYLWRAFRRLRSRKGSNGFAMMPIEWPDIDAFVRNSGISLCAWEIEVIEDLDDLFLASGPPKLED